MSDLSTSGTTGEAAVETDDLLTLDETLQFLGTSKATLYRWLGQGDLKGMKVGRQWRFRKADLVAYMERSPVAVAAAPSEAMEGELAHFAEQLRQADAVDPAEYEDDAASGKPTGWDQGTTSGEGKIALLVDRILALAICKGVSDIHIEPARQHNEAFVLLRFRLDGVLHEMRRLPTRLQDPLALRIKQMAEMNLAERKVTQDGRIHFWYDGNDFDLRVSCLPTVFGEAIVLRVLDKRNVIIGLNRLGLTPEDLARLQSLIGQPQGLVLTTGPSGSGKTTLLYSCLNALANPNRKTLTAEDPVEYILPYTTQTQINRKVGMNFPATLRSLLRQDPDVIMLAEMRDLESAELSMESAVIGHLVLSILHPNDAPSALIRLQDMGVVPFLIAQYVIGALAQRLVRRVCPHCKEPVQPARSDPDFEPLRQAAIRGGYTLPADAAFMRGQGCEQCLQTGYKGRIGLFEVMIMNPEIGKAFLKGASAQELTQIAVAHGMRTLVADGIRKAAQGITTLEEVRRVTWVPQ
jgi:type IV pilus assembly protein PilB